MARELKNVEVQFVSYVDKAANKKKFFLLKSEDQKEPNFEKEVRILTKVDDPKKLVYGIVYAPDEIDSQGDFMNVEEIEKSAHAFMKNFQKIDEQHNFTEGAGALVESNCMLADIEIGDDTITKGTWVIVTEATDEIWNKIIKGEYTGYSLAGVAGKLLSKKEKKFSDIILKYENRPMENILKDFNSTLEDMKNTDLYLPMDVLWRSIWDAMWANENDTASFKKEAKKICSQFLKYLNGMTFETVKKGEIPNKEKGDHMEKQEVQAWIDEAIEPITKALGLEKDQTLADVIQKAIGEIAPPITPVVKDEEGNEVTLVDTIVNLTKELKEYKEKADVELEAIKKSITENREVPLTDDEKADALLKENRLKDAKKANSNLT